MVKFTRSITEANASCKLGLTGLPFLSWVTTSESFTLSETKRESEVFPLVFVDAQCENFEIGFSINPPASDVVFAAIKRTLNGNANVTSVKVLTCGRIYVEPV